MQKENSGTQAKRKNYRNDRKYKERIAEVENLYLDVINYPQKQVLRQVVYGVVFDTLFTDMVHELEICGELRISRIKKNNLQCSLRTKLRPYYYIICDLQYAFQKYFSYFEEMPDKMKTLSLENIQTKFYERESYYRSRRLMRVIINKRAEICLENVKVMREKISRFKELVRGSIYSLILLLGEHATKFRIQMRFILDFYEGAFKGYERTLTARCERIKNRISALQTNYSVEKSMINYRGRGGGTDAAKAKVQGKLNSGGFHKCQAISALDEKRLDRNRGNMYKKTLYCIHTVEKLQDEMPHHKDLLEKLHLEFSLLSIKSRYSKFDEGQKSFVSNIMTDVAVAKTIKNMTNALEMS